MNAWDYAAIEIIQFPEEVNYVFCVIIRRDGVIPRNEVQVGPSYLEARALVVLLKDYARKICLARIKIGNSENIITQRFELYYNSRTFREQSYRRILLIFLVDGYPERVPGKICRVLFYEIIHWTLLRNTAIQLDARNLVGLLTL